MRSLATDDTRLITLLLPAPAACAALDPTGPRRADPGIVFDGMVKVPYKLIGGSDIPQMNAFGLTIL